MRLFIAINLPEEIKQKITQIIAQIKVEKILGNANFRWLPADNWHLTLCFLGWQPEQAIPAISKTIEKTAKRFPAPFINFEKIIFGPPSRTPRMIWLTGSSQTSKQLNEIKNFLEDELLKNKVKFQRENRSYNAHLTLARFSPTPSAVLKQTRLPKIENPAFSAQSLDLMESHLKRTGAEYEILKRVDFIQ